MSFTMSTIDKLKLVGHFAPWRELPLVLLIPEANHYVD